MRLVLTFATLIVLGLLAPRAMAADDHPAVSRYPESSLTDRHDDGFRAYTLVIGVNDKGTTDQEILEPLMVDGTVTRLVYGNPKERSAHEIFANYREGLEKGGFDILFSCEEKQCGPSFASSRWGRVTGMAYYAPEMRYLAAKSSQGDADIYVAVLVSKRGHHVEIIEATAMETGLITAKAIGEGLMRDGRVVLDGILFDTDKAAIKPESKPALDAIAEFLTRNPDLHVFIVGHTDLTGGLDHNMSLSKNRANAVAKALAEDYGIESKRLAAFGVGPLSPQKTNENEAGRGENRRVEMVQR